jgi:hypothetical protein
MKAYQKMTKYTLLFLLLLAPFFAVSQTVPEKIVAALDSFSFIQPQEKLYVQTDRDTYLSGDPVWFKALATLQEKPTVLSKILYVELVSEDGKLADKKMLKLINGSAHGGIDTKPSYPGGNYLIRAYTLWMLNFPEFVFEKKITLINAVAAKNPIKKKAVEESIAVAFYPEGGRLISSLKSTVAFKATDQFNNPAVIKGYVVNSKNENIAAIEVMHNGMGKFEFTPKDGEIYKAEITLANGKQKTVLLPGVREEGVVITVDNSSLSKTFVLVSKSSTNSHLYNNLILVAQINYQVAYMGKLNIDEGLDAAAINKKNLPPGIMQITVLTEDGKPLAERIVFVANYDSSKSLISNNIINTQKRAKNSISIDMAPYKNMNAAIAITNAEAGNNSATENILSSFLLSADIKGTVNNPVQYFKDKAAGTLNNLDLVMLTNGWRRFKLEDIMANKFPMLNYPFETGITITGKVLESNGKSILKAGKVNLIINGEDSTKIISQATTNSASAFVIDNIDYKKEATVFYQGANLNNQEAIVAVKFAPSFFDTLNLPAAGINDIFFSSRLVSTPGYYNQMILKKQSLDSGKVKTLGEVVVKSKKLSVADSLNQQYASDIFFESDQTIPVDAAINNGDIWQFLQRTVPGLSIIRSDTGTQVNFTRYQGIDYFSENGAGGVQFFLNEIAVSADVVESLYSEDIGLVKIYKGNTAITLGANRGAIALYTVKGRSTRDWRKKGFDFFKKLGYAASREFNPIDYSIIKPASKFTDLRTTIYWNPNIGIKDGKALIEFYNDDVCKKFKVVIEGIDADGKLLHIEKNIE